MKKEKISIAFLLIVTLLWSAVFPITKGVIPHMHPLAFVNLRCLVAAALFLPLIVYQYRLWSWPLLKFGLILGIINSMIIIT